MAISDSLNLTVVYEDGGDGWIMARILEVPGAMSQGRTRDEARSMAFDALRLMLTPDEDEVARIPEDARESLELTIST